MRGCFRLHAARASTSRDKPPPHGHDPGPALLTKYLCLIDTSDNSTRTPLITWRPPSSDECSSFSSARYRSLYSLGTCPTRCLDFGPLSPASQARSPLTAATTTAATTTPDPASIPLSVALSSQLNLLDLLLALVLPVPRCLELYRLSRVPGTDISLELRYKTTHATIDGEAPSSTTRRSDHPRNGIESLVASSTTTRCGFWRKPSDETPWRDIYTTGKTKPADCGQEYSQTYRCCRRGGFDFLQSYGLPRSEPQHMLVRPGARSKPRMDETATQSSHIQILAGRLGGLKDTALDHSVGQGRPCPLGTVGERPPGRGGVCPGSTPSPDLL